MKIIKLNKNNQRGIIDQTIKTLRNGGLVVFPSDTVYGLLCDATNSTAVNKLLKFKERPPGKAISVFVADEKMAKDYVTINQNAKNIINNLLPGPFTVVCQTSTNSKNMIQNMIQQKQPQKALPFEAEIDPRLLAENGTLGFRIPDYPLISELVRQFGRPVTATSANISSTPPHYSIESFLRSIGFTRRRLAGSQGDALINLIIDAGKLPHNKPSTVIDTTSGQLKTLRLGDLLPATPNSLISRKEKETSELAGFILSKVIKNTAGKPTCFLLKGELGAGKTIFTKGLAKALGIKETVVSPTYTICYEYKMTPQCHPERSRYGGRVEGSLRSKSTQKSDLSTDKPIINGGGFDIERLHRNTKLVEQVLETTENKGADEKWEVGREVGVGSGENISKTHPHFPSSTHNSPLTPTPLLIHYDLYRIESPQDLKEIKFLESIKPGNIYAIEWPERIDENTISKLKKVAQIIYIEIRHIDERTREIRWGN